MVLFAVTRDLSSKELKIICENDEVVNGQSFDKGSVLTLKFSNNLSKIVKILFVGEEAEADEFCIFNTSASEPPEPAPLKNNSRKRRKEVESDSPMKHIKFGDDDEISLSEDDDSHAACYESISDQIIALSSYPEFREFIREIVREELYAERLTPAVHAPAAAPATSSGICSKPKKTPAIVDPEIHVVLNDEKMSLLEADFPTLLAVIKNRQELLIDEAPLELDMDTIDKHFSSQLLQTFKINQPKFVHLIAQALLEEDAFKIAYLPDLGSGYRNVKPRKEGKKQLNDSFIASFLFVLNYYGGCVLDDASNFLFLLRVRESFNDRVNQQRRRKSHFAEYGDKSSKPFNCDNAF